MSRILLALLALVIAAPVAAQTLADPSPEVQAALRYAAQQAEARGQGWASAADAPLVTDAYTDAATGIAHVYLRQQLGGIEVAGANLAVTIGRDGAVAYAAGAFQPNAAARVATSSASLTAEAAVRAAAAAVGEPAPAWLAPDGALTRNRGGAQSRAVAFAPGAFSLDPVTARLVYQPVEGGVLRLAWETSFYPMDAEHYWVVRVDAQTGDELARFDLVDHDTWGEAEPAPVGPWRTDADAPLATLLPTVTKVATMAGSYLVYAMPTESPSHAGSTTADLRTTVANPSNATASPYGWHDTNGAAGAEYTVTRGNNAYAYTDTDANNTPDAGSSPDGGAGLTFAPPLDLTMEPATYRPAAVVNLFYWNNIVHDVMYPYGFTEAAGNFQTNTYGRGGAGSDAVNAEAQDGSGTSNANFGTPPDGFPPRMQMYRWTYATPNRDSDFDAGVIAHEYTHGISNRLTGGPSNVACLDNEEQMGEGWSDYVGLMLTMRAGDTRTTTRGLGTYLRGQPTTGVGLRPAPYTTSLDVNNYTYQRTRSGLSVPHGIGFVWTTILWEATWDLIDRYGFSANLYNATGSAGNQIMLRLVTEGLKLQPCSPGFVDGRDAILAADAALYPDAAHPGRGLHYVLLWNAFARRGLGLTASQGSTDSNADNTEAFDVPLPAPAASIAPGSVQVVVQQGGTATATVTFANTAAAGSGDLNFTANIQNATVPLTGAVPEASRTARAAMRAATAPAATAPAAPWVDTSSPVAPAPQGVLPATGRAPAEAPVGDTSGLQQVPCTGGQFLTQDAAGYVFPMGVGPGKAEFGQSFTSPCRGYINTLRVILQYTSFPNETWTGVLRVYEGEGTTGTEVGATPISFTNGTSGAAFVNFPLTAPVFVREGQVYTWFIDMTSGSSMIQYNLQNPYAGGVEYIRENGTPATAYAQLDMAFQLTFAAPENWVAVSQTGGNTPAGSSRTVTLTLDATHLDLGTYTADLVVTTNDPAVPTRTIPITLTVATFGYTPGAVSATLPPGQTTTATVTLSNGSAPGTGVFTYSASLANIAGPGGPGGCTPGQVLSGSPNGGIFLYRSVAGADEAGHSFTVPCNGRLTTVTPVTYLNENNSWTGTLRLYQGAGTTGPELAAVPVAGSNQTGVQTPFTATFPTPVAVTAGQVYTWFLDLSSGVTGFSMDLSQGYPGGTMYATSNGNPASAVAQNRDLAFTATLDVGWVGLAPTTGSIQPGGTAALGVTFDATGLADGTYTADLVLATNDLGLPSATIPLSLTVGLPPTYTVTAPDANAVVLAGSKTIVRWNGSGVPDKTVFVTVYGQQGDAAPVLLGTFKNTGKAKVTIPAGTTTGSGYRLTVALATDETVFGTSAAFAVYTTGEQYTFGSPLGNESWARGTTHTVTWTAPPSAPAGTVALALYRSNGTLVLSAAGEPNDGSFAYAIPVDLATGDDLYVTITNETDAAFFGRSAGFRISRFEVIAPSAASTWAQGSSQTVTWTAGGNAAGTVRIALKQVGGGFSQSLASNVAYNLYTRTVTVPPVAPAGQYFVQLLYTQGATRYTVNSAPFAVTGPLQAPPVVVSHFAAPQPGPDARETVLVVRGLADGAEVGVFTATPQGDLLLASARAEGGEAVVSVPSEVVDGDDELAFGPEAALSLRVFDGTSEASFEASSVVLGSDGSSLENARLASGDVVVAEGVSKGASSAPAAFALAGVSPNPTSGSAVVRFTAPSSARATVVVYDVLGRSVATVFDGPAVAGLNEVSVRTQSLPAGVYVVRVTAGRESAAARFTVVR